MNYSDRRIVLVSVLVGAIALCGVYFINSDAPDVTASVAVDSDSTSSVQQTIVYAQPQREGELFTFDPNTADSTQLLRLGLRPWQVRNIYKYRARGGVYRRREDFARLYGLTLKDYRRLEPYICISPDFQPASAHIARPPHDVDSTRHYVSKLSAGSTVDLSTADTTSLMRVPGIGSYYARQIVRYGERLGGYVSIGQLDEIDGFPSEAKAYFTLGSAAPRRLALNRLSLQQLRRHPYLNFYQARAIVDYRRLHGRIDSLQQLRFDSSFSPADFQRLAPYVSTE